VDCINEGSEAKSAWLKEVGLKRIYPQSDDIEETSNQFPSGKAKPFCSCCFLLDFII